MTVNVWLPLEVDVVRATRRPQQGPPTGGAADTVFVNGPVYTVDAARSWTDAVAVRDGRIAALGGEAVRALVGRRTEVIDIAGKMLLPGFIDAHVHPIMGGVERALCDLTGTSSSADCLTRITQYARRHTGRAWILGGGWSMDHFPSGTPSRRDLDHVVPDRPVYLVNRDHHGAWVNSRALELSGVGADTPDPPDGRFERVRDGAPARHQPGRVRGRARGRPAPPALAGDHRVAGRDHRAVPWPQGHAEHVPGIRRIGAADGAGRGRAVVGPRPWRGPVGRTGRAAGGRPGGPVPRGHRQDHAGRRLRELQRRDARPLPRRPRQAHGEQ